MRNLEETACEVRERITGSTAEEISEVISKYYFDQIGEPTYFQPFCCICHGGFCRPNLLKFGSRIRLYD